MRVTAIAQGINRWLDSLHRQVPLTGRESQHLLNALTGSFRKQLDEAHPTKAQDELNPASQGTLRNGLASLKIPDSSPKTANGPTHAASAVESADRHLASVLTNPLLMGLMSAESTAASPRPGRARRPNTVPEVQIRQNEGVKAVHHDKATAGPTPLTPKTLPLHAQAASKKHTDIARILQEPSLLAEVPEEAEKKDERLIVKDSEVTKIQQAHSAAAHSALTGPGLDVQISTKRPRRATVLSKPIRHDYHESNRDNLWYHLARPAS
jgi:hypothetical protein